GRYRKAEAQAREAVAPSTSGKQGAVAQAGTGRGRFCASFCAKRSHPPRTLSRAGASGFRLLPVVAIGLECRKKLHGEAEVSLLKRDSGNKRVSRRGCLRRRVSHNGVSHRLHQTTLWGHSRLAVLADCAGGV